MQPTDDRSLLRQYADNNSDEAFATLVTRHINLVYSVALRHVGNPHNAEEITQAVFIILAKKAAQMREVKALSGWLFQVTRLTVNNFVRSESRRHRREQEAHMQSILNEPETEIWLKIAPLLDTAVAGLREKDRQAIVLRFYEGRNLREIGLVLGASEDAAEKRVTRALEKLRKFFTKHGVSLTTAIIAGTISANSVQAAPTALAKSVTAVAIAKGAAASISTLTLIKGALKLMAWTKMKTAVMVGVAALLAVGTTAVIVKKITSPSVEGYFTNMDSGYLNTAPPLVLLRPSRYVGQGAYIITTQPDIYNPGKVMRRDCSFAAVLATAYNVDKERVVLPADAPKGQFDLLLTVPDHQAEALRAETKRQFGLVGHLETRNSDALVLRVSNPAASGLEVNSQGNEVTCHTDNGQMTGINLKMSDLAYHLGASYLNLPVIDETGLTSSYDFELQWNATAPRDDQKNEIRRALNGQLGLELVPTNMPVEMLVVEKAQ